ncbi:MAG: hypothetical protein A3I66_00820 [Burkholderiales bacterium RIFCSPLOWO2_02_FULL_57_36]|nr:MAG: hypothetical protein A3I66_00820 [Burkholderiales bacterium RIFCSPLOWO2_02_FULL_57_36]
MSGKTPAAKPHIEQVRQSLLDTLADLRSRENPMDIERAKAVATVASVLVDTAKVENEYLKLTGQDRSDFLEIPADPPVAHLGVSESPAPRNGITAITRHHLRG